MDFGLWLVHKQLLTRQSFREIMSEEFRRIFLRYHGAGGYQTCSIDELADDLESIRQIPFGELLGTNFAILREVLQKSGRSNIHELAEDWYAWHCDHLEPICDYCLKNHMGEHLYKQQGQKKLVAQFLVNAYAGNSGPIIRENDTVILPEGTSTLYVGLAIAAHKREVTVHTSNSGLIREYRHNPVLEQRLKDMFIIGGKADWKHCEVEGEKCSEQYLNVLSENHSGIVLIIPVTRLTPEQGPTATGPSWKIRGDIVRKGLRREVLRVVFIADHTKLSREPVDDEHPIFITGNWREIVEEYKNRILIVTSVPPNLQNVHDILRVYGMSQELEVKRRNLDTLIQQDPIAGLDFAFSDADKAYDEVAKQLDDMVSDSTATRFWEVFEGDKRTIRQVVLRFSAVEGTVTQDRMLEFLNEQLAPGGTSPQLVLHLSWHESHLDVEIQGDAQVLYKICQLTWSPAALYTAFNNISISLEQVTVEGMAQNGPWKVNSDRMPVDDRAIMRSALGGCPAN